MDKPDGLKNDWGVIKLLLDEIRAEQHSMDTRMNTYHGSQSFLFAAYALSSLGEHTNHQAIHWFCNYMVPGIGILFSLFMALAISQGRARLFDLDACLRRRLKQVDATCPADSSETLCLPSLSARKRGLLYATWVPVICGVVWIYVGLHSAWYEFVKPEVSVHHGTGTRKAGHGPVPAEEDN
jgi:hypothetical protein